MQHRSPATNSFQTILNEIGLTSEVNPNKRLEDSIPFSIFTDLALSLKLDKFDLAKAMGISPSSLIEIAQNNKFSRSQSQRFYKMIIVLDEALTLFEGDWDSVIFFVNNPAIWLNGRKPLSLFVNNEGVAQVSSLIKRLEHGVI